MMKHRTLHPGFTLIELLLYTTLTGMLLLVLSVFLGGLLEAQVKNRSMGEVEQQGLQIMQRITQTVRNAESITAPVTGASASTLTLNVLSAGADPTVFDLSGSTLRIKEGAAVALPLTNNRVNVSGLSFQNLSRAGTPGVLRITFTLTHINPLGRYEYDVSKTFNATAALRYP